MNFLSSLLGSAAAEPITAVGNVIDKIFTSDEERLDKKIIIERLKQQPALVQAEINKVEASHRSMFVAGWRPFIGWVCGISFVYSFLLVDIVQWALGTPIPNLDDRGLFDLTIAMLGMGTLRTVEKIKGKSK